MNDQLVFEDFDPAPERYPPSFLPPDPQGPHIKKIHIKAFKGIEDMEVEFPKIAILTGPNNSGKSTVLQAIVACFECLRICLDTDRWEILKHGRAVKEFDFLPINVPKDLFFRTRTRVSREQQQEISISLTFTNDFYFTSSIRFMYGLLNARITDYSKPLKKEILQMVSSLSPVLIPGISGLTAHEPLYSLPQIYKIASTVQLSSILRNILWDLQEPSQGVAEPNESIKSKIDFIWTSIKRHFGIELKRIEFDPRRDLEIRAPYFEEDYELDIVSGGGGMNQILQLISFIVWRNSRIILFDEPDSHLHTSLQLRLYSFLKEISDKMNLQIILATHSRDLISQAPMDSIVPVDLKEKRLKPIQSIEHLLVEFKRQGTISNVDLALLYQAKKCLFVEGEDDKGFLPMFADKLQINCFQGTNQVVIFKFRGADKFSMVPDLVKLFEEMVGCEIKWMVLRDRDYAIPKIIEKYKQQAVEKSISNYHIWEKFCIENYLLEPASLHSTILKKISDKGDTQQISKEDIQRILSEICNEVAKEAKAQYITQTQNFYRKFELCEDPMIAGASDAQQFLDDSLKNLEDSLKYLPGDKIFGQFVKKLQENFGLNIRSEDVILTMKPEAVPSEIKEFLSRLEKYEQQGRA